MPFFSVVIPTYNRAQELKRALDSLAAQTYKDFEVIVCDDGSTDNSKAVAESFQDRLTLKYVWEKNWGGPARPRNNGLSAATGEWICFLDADDWWYPEKLAVTAAYTVESDVIYHDLDIRSVRSSILRGFFFPMKAKTRRFSPPVFHDMMLNDAGIPNSSAVVRKVFLKAVEGFTEDKALIAVEDLDLWLKIARITERFSYIPMSLGAYGVGGVSISEISEKQISRLTALYDRHAHYLSEGDQKQALALLNYNKGRIKFKNGHLPEARILLAQALVSKNLSIKLKAMATIACSRLGLRL